MAKIKQVNRSGGGLHGYWFHCPGCGDKHVLPTTGPNAWGFNGSLDAPTFTPSVLVHSHKALDDQGRKVDTPRCHSYVTDGRIQYLSDTTHALSGQTVDLPEVGNAELND